MRKAFNSKTILSLNPSIKIICQTILDQFQTFL